MRGADGDTFWLHGDHLGSTSLTTDEDGDVVARQLYYPFGETRWVTGTLQTDFSYTGQRDDAYTQLYQMGVRWYDGRIGRWTSADTIVPYPANPQSLNRYSYVYNNALRYVDPSGHQSSPPPLDPTIQAAIDYFSSIGWQIVGDPSLIHPNWNMADLVFTGPEGRVLAVELKEVAGNINLGTLERSPTIGDYGGSLTRIVRSASRFENSSVDQLRSMSRTVLDAARAGKLENALFHARSVASNELQKTSTCVQNLFSGVYRLGQNGVVQVTKSLPELKKPDFWAKVGMGARTFLKWGQAILTDLGNAATVPPFFFAPGPKSPFWQPYFLYSEPVDA